MPFLVEKIMSMFTHIILKLAIVDGDDEDDVPADFVGNDIEREVARK